MDRRRARVLGTELETVLAEFAAKNGLEVENKGGKFDSLSFAPKFEFREVGVESREALDFKSEAHYYGLEPTDLGREFMSNGKTFRITGLKTRNRTMPIIAENVVNGRSYKFRSENVKMALSR